MSSDDGEADQMENRIELDVTVCKWLRNVDKTGAAVAVNGLRINKREWLDTDNDLNHCSVSLWGNFYRTRFPFACSFQPAILDYVIQWTVEYCKFALIVVNNKEEEEVTPSTILNPIPVLMTRLDELTLVSSTNNPLDTLF